MKTLDPYKLDPTLAHVPNPYFASGERYVSDLFEALACQVGTAYRPKTGVDFGCSVGRIAIPLAKRCDRVIGLDVSERALTEAGSNAMRFGVSNVSWERSDDAFSRLPERIDFFHSYNVLQHLPVKRGLRIVRNALGRLKPDGVLAIHVPYADRAPIWRQAVNWAQAYIPAVNRLANVVRRRPHDYPHMQMNAYDLTTLLSMFQEHGCESSHCRFIDQGRYPGAIVVARMGATSRA